MKKRMTEMRQVSERWYVDEYGSYYLYLEGGQFIFYGTPEKESEVIKKLKKGEIALESTPITVIDGKKIYHVYNPNLYPRPHYDILVDTP